MAAVVVSGTVWSQPAPLWQESFEGAGAAPDTPGWHLPEGARVVASEGVGGGHCLHVPRPDARGFAELNVPVTPGTVYRGSAMVRCRDATGPKGAVLYLQFSDANRKHVNGGSFPKGLIGTHDWRRVEVHHTIPIPENVAYVRVTVGIDGTGEAWFDDLRLEEVTDWTGLQPVAPVNGTTVDTALPVLRWEPWGDRLGPLGASRYACQLQVSRDPDFVDTVTVGAFPGIDSNRCRVERALSAGTWHWRVNLLRDGIAFPPSRSASFVVADDAAVWPPQLIQDWAWSDAPRPELVVRVAPSEASVGSVSALIGGAPARVTEVADGCIRFRPVRDLPVGVHEVTVTVSPPAAAGEGVEAVNLVGVFCNKQPSSRVTFRADGIMLVDGVPTFPIGAYRDPSDREDTFDGLLEAGFDVTHSYHMDGQGIREPERAHAYLRAAHAHGISVFLGLPRGMVRARETAALARYVADTMDVPGLLAWYQFDEPEIQDCSPDDLMATYRAISAVDPFHPKITLVCSIKFPVTDRFRAYAAGCDVFWEDPYPVPSRPLLMVEEKIRACIEATGPGKPVWCVVQGHSWAAWHAWKALTLKSKGTRSPETIAAMRTTGTVPATRPNAVETRCMAHLAIAAGAKGLIWYWSPNYAVHVQEDSPEIWAGIKDTVAELRGLMPWLIAEPTPGDDTTVPAPLRCWSRAAEGRRVRVLINPEPDEVVVKSDEVTPVLRSFLGEGDGDLRVPAHGVLIR